MKKLLGVLLVVVMVTTLVPVSVFAATSTSSAITATPDWYSDKKLELTISSVEDLWAFMEQGTNVLPEQTVKLTCDLDLNEGWVAAIGATPPTNWWTPISFFGGIFDGQGHTIRGLYMYGNDRGLVRDLVGTIKNLSIKNALVDGDILGWNGTFAKAMQHGSLLENCYTDAIMVTSGEWGGLGGFAHEAKGDATVRKCWFDGLISSSGDAAAGIMVQINGNSVVMEDCLNTGTILGKADGKYFAGICPEVYQGTITISRCVNNGLLATDVNGTTLIGSGICYTFGEDSQNSVWTNCYTVDGTAASSLPDNMYQGSALTIDGTKYTHEDIGEVANTLGWIGNATDPAAYVGFDFNGDTWVMGENGPELKAFSKATSAPASSSSSAASSSAASSSAASSSAASSSAASSSAAAASSSATASGSVAPTGSASRSVSQATSDSPLTIWMMAAAVISVVACAVVIKARSRA